MLYSNTSAYTNFRNLLAHLFKENQSELAIQICKYVLQAQPHFFTTLSSFGSFNEYMDLLDKTFRYEEAIEICSQLLSINSKDPRTWHYLGFFLSTTRRYKESIHAYQTAIDMNPDFLSQTRWNQSRPLLMTGNLKKGFEAYEARLSFFKTTSLAPTNKTQEWQGEDISGKTLLVHHDGGFGDSFQFLRYVPYLKKYNCDVALFLQPELNGLFKHLGVPLLQEGLPCCPYDVHVFMMSLPFCFRTELSDIPPPVEIDCCHRPVKGRIGIVWEAGTGVTNEKGQKSLHLAQLDSILKIPGIHYVCLQKVVSAEDAKLLDAYAIQRPPIGSFEDTVKILEECERVICVDTSVAHLSASMGIPTWILLPYISCWRWLIDRTDSPWYPSAKLFRQCKLNCWDEPLREVEQELKAEHHAHDLRKNLWEVTEFVWNIGILSRCDIKMQTPPIEYFSGKPHFHKSDYQNIKNGDIVWVKSSWIRQFYQEILPEVKSPFVLVVNDGDESFPSECCKEMTEEELIDDDKIIHIFAQNCDYRGPSLKVSHIPIGIDFHTIAYKSANGLWGETGSPLEQEAEMKRIIQTLRPTHLRKKRAFVDFQHSDSLRGSNRRYLQFGEDRTTIFHRLLHTAPIDHAGWMRRTDLWKIKGQYAFSISPHGNGLDCHRTWEDLILGCIVIVKTSPLDPLYEGLPVVIVQDWSEVTEDNMTLWFAQYHDAFANLSYREKLTNAYWIRKIQVTAQAINTQSCV